MKTEGLGCLLIDLQDVFLNAMPDADALKRRCAFVIRACSALGIPIYFSTQVPGKLGYTNAELRALAPDAFEFGKSTFSAWSSEALQQKLRSDGIRHLILGGIETPICVYQTSIGAHADDFEITLLSDAISCRRPQDAQAVLNTLNAHGILALPSETIFYSLLGDVDHPAFKAMTRLVKEA